MLGHADDTMVKEVYAHNDDKIKTNKLEKAIKRVEQKSNIKEKSSILQALFAYDSLKQLETMKNTGIDILPLSKQCISIIKETSRLDKAIHLFELSPKEKQKEFIDKVKELDNMVYWQAYSRYITI